MQKVSVKYYVSVFDQDFVGSSGIKFVVSFFLVTLLVVPVFDFDAASTEISTLKY